MKTRRSCIPFLILLTISLSVGWAAGSPQQWTPEKRGSDNIQVVSHLPLGAALSIADIEIEQEMDRPYALSLIHI